MIRREKLMPVLEKLTEGRNDVADIIESINAIDEDDVVDVDGINSEWQRKYDDLNNEWIGRYRRAVFKGEIETVADVPSTADVIAQQEDMTEPETFDDLFSEQEVLR